MYPVKPLTKKASMEININILKEPNPHPKHPDNPIQAPKVLVKIVLMIKDIFPNFSILSAEIRFFLIF